MIVPSHTSDGGSQHNDPRRVLLSYARDDDRHTEQVFRFCNLLRDNGIDAWIDRYDENERQDWPDWFGQQLKQSRHVIVVVSPAYRAASDGDPGTDHHLVRMQAEQLRELHLRNNTRRLLPVVLPGRSAADIPQFLQPWATDHYTITELTRAGIEPLLRILTGQPLYPPPELGPRSPIAALDLSPYTSVTNTGELDRDQLLDQLAEKLAAVVKEQWEKERDIRHLQDRALLQVRWTAADETLADHWENILGRSPAPSSINVDGHLDGIVGLFDWIRLHRLVVLGKPGAGKSVLAMVFTLKWLARRREGEPVPVVFPLASWDPSREDLHSWMSTRLAMDYPWLTSAADELVRTRRILPVLDGLDEISPGRHKEALQCLDKYAAYPVLLTSRTTDFKAAVDQANKIIRFAVVIELLSVDIDDIDDYLPFTTRPTRGSGGALTTTWHPVLDQLRHPANPNAAALAGVLSTPLMVSMAREAYSDTGEDPGELLDDRFADPDTLEGHLLDAFVPASFAPHDDEDTRQWDREDAERWITFLAQHLDRLKLKTGDIAWWRLEAALPAPVRLLSPGILLGIVTIPVAVIIYLVNGYAGFLALTPGFALGVPLSLAASGRSRSADPQPVSGWGRRRIARQIAIVAATGLLVGLPFGAAQNFGDSADLVATNTTGLAALLAFGLLFGVATGIIFGAAGIDRQPQPSTTSIWSRHQPGSLLYRFATRFLIGFTPGVVLSESVLALLNIDPAVIPPFNVVSNSLNFGYFGKLLPSLTVGVVLGLFFGLTAFTTRSSTQSYTSKPSATQRRRGLISVVVAATAVGIVFWFAVGLAAGTLAALRKDAKGDDFPPGGSYHSRTDGERYADYSGGVRYGRLPNGIAYITFSNMTVTFHQNSDGNTLNVDINPSSTSVRCTGSDGCLTELTGPVTYTSKYDAILPDHSRITSYGTRLAPNGTTIEQVSDYETPADISWLDEKSPGTMLFANVRFGLFFGLAFGLVAGVAGWLYLRLDVPADLTTTPNPSSSLKADRSATFVRSLTVMFLVLIFGGIAAVNVGGTTTLIWAWVPISLAAISVTAWWRLAVARAWLSARRRLPWRLMGFLKWAHKRGVLRQAGAMYQFRHALLQKRLAQHIRETRSPQT